MPNWKSPEAFPRLLAALVAANETKVSDGQKPANRIELDYRKIATYYGEGATYDSIEGRFRIIKKDAQRLRDEISSGQRAPAPVRGSSSINGNDTTPKKPRAKKAPGTPTPKKDKVISGRVGKTSTLKRNDQVKSEIIGNGTMDEDKDTSKRIKGIKEEVASSDSSRHGGEDDIVDEVVGMPMADVWNLDDLSLTQGYGVDMDQI